MAVCDCKRCVTEASWLMSQDHNYSPHKLCISQQLMQGQSFFNTAKMSKAFPTRAIQICSPWSHGYSYVRKEIASDSYFLAEVVNKRNPITCDDEDPRYTCRHEREEKVTVRSMFILVLFTTALKKQLHSSNLISINYYVCQRFTDSERQIQGHTFCFSATSAQWDAKPFFRLKKLKQTLKNLILRLWGVWRCNTAWL